MAATAPVSDSSFSVSSVYSVVDRFAVLVTTKDTEDTEKTRKEITCNFAPERALKLGACFFVLSSPFRVVGVFAWRNRSACQTRKKITTKCTQV